MTATLRKTSAREWREQIDAEVRDTGLRKLTRAEMRKRHGEDPFEADTDIPFGGPEDRASKLVPSVPDDARACLDSLLERHGLQSIVKTLRELCDSRQPSIYETDMTFEKLDREEAWGERAEALESVIGRLK